MKKIRGLLVGLLVTCGTAPGWAVNHVTVESKSVAINATSVQVGVFVENDLPIIAIVVPLELRSASPGTYVTTAFIFAATAAGRVNNSPLGAAGPTWPAANVTSRRYAVTSAPACSGPVSNTYNSPAIQIDFVSPDAILHAAVSTGDPNIGEDITLLPGSDPVGTPSFMFTFNVNGVDGLFEIDSCCARPANHLSYVDELTQLVPPTFTKGVITVGNPIFPPVVTDIPDQTINEGQTFATVTLDNFVSDLDDPDASLTWTASGQSQLFVSISPARVATISTPNPDWFGAETITFRATDGDGQFDVDAATFTANPVNDPPILANITNKFRLAGLSLAFNISGTDVDNACGELTFSMENVPAGATLTNDGACGAAFNWPTVCLDSGVYNVTFIVTDSLLADTQVVQITILPNPDRFDTNPDSLEFTFALEQSQPDSQELGVSDPGCGEMTFEVLVSEPWLLVSPATGMTSTLLLVDIDTTGLPAGDYTALIIIRQTGFASPESTVVAVKLKVTEELCICTCHADPPPACDGIHNIQSIVLIINVAFRGALDVGEATCPVSFNDANCDCAVDILDVVRIIDFVWRSGAPLCNPCTDVTTPCELVSH